MPDFTFDLFLSHNSKDKPEVVSLNALLLQRGLNGWLDKQQLPPGQNWQRLIEEGLKNSRAIAACFGRAGIGPWHDEEMQAAMNIAVKQRRPVIPVLLPGSATKPELPLFLQNRGWVDFRNGFTEEAIDILVWGITGKKPDKDGEESASGASVNPPPPDPEEYERKVREVFGPQYDQLKGILERHAALRESLAARYAVAGQSAQQITAYLIEGFHADFCEAIGQFAQIHEEARIDRDALLELVSTVLYLSMCPDYAQGLLDDDKAMKFEVSADAKQGIAEMLLAWTRKRGQGAVPVKHLSQEKAPETFETPPQMAMPTMKHSLMDRLGINRDAPDADTQLEIELESRKLFGHAEYQAMEGATEADRALIREIQAKNSPLRDLLLLIKKQGQTIHPRREAENPHYDRRVEHNLAKLIRELRNP